MMKIQNLLRIHTIDSEFQGKFLLLFLIEVSPRGMYQAER